MNNKFEKANKIYANEEYEEALECYKEVLEEAKANGEKNLQSSVLYNMGVCCIKLDKPHEAISYYKKSLSFKNKNNISKNAFNLALMYSKLGDFKQGYIYANVAYSLEPDDEDTLKMIKLIEKNIEQEILEDNNY
jgi:tetratricopeptide (TPR) repeat protein